MYAILVNEPGAEIESFVLSTGASTSESAMQLMSSRAEEYVDEQLEQEPTEDYTVQQDSESLSVIVMYNGEDDPGAVLKLYAVAIDKVV
ncbi:hypothetical protein D3C87_1045840 [compost metagenome]